MKIPKHITRPYNLIMNQPLLHNLFENYIRKSYPRFIFENFRNKFRNFRKKKPLGFFQSVLIEINSACNRRCWYCPNTKYKRPVRLMPEKLFRKIIDELAEAGYSGVIAPHFFNEPLLDKRLPDLMIYTKNKLPISKIILYTNGDFLTIEKFKKLVNTGVDIFEITEHDDKPSKRVKKLFDFLEKNPGYKRYVNYRKNLYLEDRAGLVEVKEKQKRKRCSSSLFNMTINYKGEVILCCQDFFGEAVFGNAKNENVVDIWNKKGYKKIRELNKKGKFILPICKKCVSN